MTQQDPQPIPDDLPELPDPLLADLSDLYRPEGGIPEEINERVLFEARRQLGDRRRMWRWGGIGVIAAAIMLVFWMQETLQTPTHFEERTRATSTIAHDIDGSGHVDILDAFNLARRLQAGHTPLRSWDFNADGRVDQADVDAVALAAVSLNGGES